MTLAVAEALNPNKPNQTNHHRLDKNLAVVKALSNGNIFLVINVWGDDFPEVSGFLSYPSACPLPPEMTLPVTAVKDGRINSNSVTGTGIMFLVRRAYRHLP